MILTRIPFKRLMAASTLPLLLSACVTTGYHEQVSSTMGAVQAGSPDAALDALERANANEKEKDLLYFLEKGELLRMKGSHESSRDTLLRADAKVRAWEDEVKTDPSKLLGNVGSFLINDTTRRYDGRDYEKVFVSVRLAQEHLALGKWEDARIEIKKMHEREAIIADFRSKELDEAKKQSQEKGLKTTSFKELNGYPVETLDDPAVRSLKNAYESAFANYLAGFVYEALGETSLASAGYRKAIEMRPGEKMLEESLKGLDGRLGKRKRGTVDTLIVVETGSAPAITSRTLPIVLPIPSRGGLALVATPISWPIVQAVDASVIPSSIAVDDKTVPISLLTNVDLMARKAMSDEMPGIIFRSSIRAIAKGIAQKAVQDNTSSMGLAGSLLSVAAGVAAVATEKADERTWRTLPAFYSVARVSLPEGSHRFTLRTRNGNETREVQLSGAYAVVDFHASGNALYVSQTPYSPAPVLAPEPAQTKAKGKKAMKKVEAEPVKVKP